MYSSLSNKRAAQLIIFWKNYDQKIFKFSLIYDLEQQFHSHLMDLCLFWQLLAIFFIGNGFSPPYTNLDCQNYQKLDWGFSNFLNIWFGATISFPFDGFMLILVISIQFHHWKWLRSTLQEFRIAKLDKIGQNFLPAWYFHPAYL